jgi:hypothetical protein
MPCMKYSTIHGGTAAQLHFALRRELVLVHGLHKALWRAIPTDPEVPSPILGGLYYARVGCFQDLRQLIGSVEGRKDPAP